MPSKRTMDWEKYWERHDLLDKFGFIAYAAACFLYVAGILFYGVRG
jgi:hypothetical protein